MNSSAPNLGNDTGHEAGTKAVQLENSHDGGPDAQGQDAVTAFTDANAIPAPCPPTCPDQNPCTFDHVLPDCTCAHDPLPLLCDDNNACTLSDACTATQCVGIPLAATACADSNPCTTDFCDPKTGCAHTNADGIPCDDGNLCTSSDLCAAGACAPGVPIACDCTADADCAPKDDGNLCNGTLHCDKAKLPYLCAVNPKTLVTCDPASDALCAIATCLPATGLCALKPTNTDGPCTDDNPCTTGDHCISGTCLPTALAPCDDANPCTADGCALASGCTHTTLPDSTACDADGSLCTTADHCVAGGCTAGSLLTCSDTNPCTDDSCVPATGCIFLPNAATCTDGDACTTADICAAGLCKPGKPGLACDDGNPCTADGCLNGQCGHTGLPDGATCTQTGAACQKGLCIHEAWDMVYIPGGTIWMGCDQKIDPKCSPTEGKLHLVKVAPFWMARHETAMGQFKTLSYGSWLVLAPDYLYKFLKPLLPITPVGPAYALDQPTLLTHPINGVGTGIEPKSGPAAGYGYCAGRFPNGYTTAADYPTAQLPTEAQWELAARGSCESFSGDCKTALPKTTWGAGPPPPNTENLADNSYQFVVPSAPILASYYDGAAYTAPIGTYKPNVNGLYDMGGNVAEMVADCYHEHPDGAPADGSAWGSCGNDDNQRMVKGPSFASAANVSLTQKRQQSTFADPTVGFRCARKVIPCDDGDDCTKDVVAADGSCTHPPAYNGGVCWKGDFCAGVFWCQAGKCVLKQEPQYASPGYGTNCSDTDPCTLDLCDKQMGCLHLPAKANCDDNNPCTTDDCTEPTGCTHLPNAASCTDSDECTSGDACAGGVCKSQPKNCDDANSCTNDSCSGTTGYCQHVPAAVPYGAPCGPAGSCINGYCSAWMDEMISVPAGQFWYGKISAVAVGSPPSSYTAPLPESSTLVTLPAFAIDKYEVTVAAFAACVVAGVCGTTKPVDGGNGHCNYGYPTNDGGQYPINCVTTAQAATYCKWGNKRLPSNTEWTMAARGSCALYPGQDCFKAMPYYPWGNGPADCLHAVAVQANFYSYGCTGNGLTPVGSRPLGVSPYGIHDLAGNASELVADCVHQGSLMLGPLDGAAWTTQCLLPVLIVVRGGAYKDTIGVVGSTQSWSLPEGSSRYDVGFRCAKSL